MTYFAVRPVPVWLCKVGIYLQPCAQKLYKLEQWDEIAYMCYTWTSAPTGLDCQFTAHVFQ